MGARNRPIQRQSCSQFGYSFALHQTELRQQYSAMPGWWHIRRWHCWSYSASYLLIGQYGNATSRIAVIQSSAQGLEAKRFELFYFPIWLAAFLIRLDIGKGNANMKPVLAVATGSE